MAGAGDRRDRIVIQNKSMSQDAVGQPEEEWVDRFERWAFVRHTYRGAERFVALARQIDVSAYFSFDLIYDPDLNEIDPTYRIVWEGRVYDIQNVWKFSGRVPKITYDCMEKQ